MPRTARVVVPGMAHHVTQRGNNKQDVFFVDRDRKTYLLYLKEQSEKWGLTVLGYCLMTNHIHLIVVPDDEKALAKGIGRTHWLYTQYLNRFHTRSGHLWQNRFYSCALDHSHLIQAMAYVELNPVRAGLTEDAISYQWSSAAAHVGGKDESNMIDHDEWMDCTPGIVWEDFLGAGDKLAINSIRLHTCRGRPLGSDSCVSKLETKLGLRLRPLKVGRPKKR